MRPKVDLKKASTPPDNQRGVDNTFSEMLSTKYQAKNYRVGITKLDKHPYR